MRHSWHDWSFGMGEGSAVERCTCRFSGRVQGVGFRYTVQNIAQQHNVNGYVRNLPDGRVELVMEGPDSEIEQVVDAVNQRMTGFIASVDLHKDSPTGEFDQFRIRH